MKIERTVEEIEDLEARAHEQANEGGKFPGLTYEDGVAYALRWLLHKGDPDPLEE